MPAARSSRLTEGADPGADDSRGRIAFLFPGQGSQRAGMGVELLRDPEIADLAGECSAAAGLDLVRLLTSADDDELRLTHNAQPALVFAGVALARLLARRGIRPAASAGHSVGEYTALCVSGALTPAQAVKTVVARGRAMAEAAPPGTTSMLAVLGLDADVVCAALAGAPEVWPANFNTPTQTVIGGSVAGLEEARERLQAAGARRLLPLNVAAAFHTPLMQAAAAALRGALQSVGWAQPAHPVMANLTAQPYGRAGDIPSTLERQLVSPVRWADCVRALNESGCDVFYEVGPSRALTGMMRELAPAAAASAVSSPEAVERLE
ncbi:MAG: ACP S-malonyltransferase [Candidatus Dormibacteraeota bacterium]|nr:ACP S-malonyltransferase [Candidatus Dormibacteraeota bacterium]